MRRLRRGRCGRCGGADRVVRRYGRVVLADRSPGSAIAPLIGPARRATRAELIERPYEGQQRHSALGYLSPWVFEQHRE